MSPARETCAVRQCGYSCHPCVDDCAVGPCKHNPADPSVHLRLYPVVEVPGARACARASGCGDLEKLQAFFVEVARLTSEHDVLGDSAVVYPRNLGDALAKVDPDWWKNTTQESNP